MKRRDILAAGALLSVLPLTACGVGPDPTPTYRYRLTVEVDTPDGLKTGSSVIEVETHIAGKTAITTPGRVTQKARGEAVAVDLGEGRTLFALLRSPTDVDWAGNVMTLLVPGSHSFQQRFDFMLENGRVIELPPYFEDRAHIQNRLARPMLVTFRDLADPSSVAEVEPDDLATSFGDGVDLERMTVQLTNDPLTMTIEDRLTWLANVRGALVKIPISERPPTGLPLPLHATLSETAFLRSW
ncbi:hypothetical protein N8940_01440 [Sphingomonadaceae bacterium]|nr:hypothetical protein [Sphingomonadaceae bacterium]